MTRLRCNCDPFPGLEPKSRRLVAVECHARGQLHDDKGVGSTKATRDDQTITSGIGSQFQLIRSNHHLHRHPRWKVEGIGEKTNVSLDSFPTHATWQKVRLAHE